MAHKTCIVCGQPSRTSRCATHTPRNGRSKADQRTRQAIAATASHCWICGQPPRPNDPFTADHIIPRILGGPDHPSNYRAAHRSCNSRRGARHPGG